MDFLDEDSRPRFVFSRPPPSSAAQTSPPTTVSKTLLFVTLPIACIFLSLSFLTVETEPLKSVLIWLSLSLLIGPFAPASVTGGNIRVGHGPIIPDPQPEPEHKQKKHSQKRSSKIELGFGNPRTERNNEETAELGSSLDPRNRVEEAWTDEDTEILKKQMAKNPVGKPRRWEVIAEAFNGRYKVESVISKSKELGMKKVDDSDSYARFLKNRKVDERIHGGNDNIDMRESNVGDTGWSSGDDIGLLNAMKAFPKDVAMRWEKIAAAVPGKTKAGCMKRATELKKQFRSSKPVEKS